MGLYQDGKIEFEEEMAMANVALATSILSPLNVWSKIKFGSFDYIMLTSNVEETSNPQDNGGKACSSTSEDPDNEGWILVTHRRRGKKSPPKDKQAPRRSKMVKQPFRKVMPKVMSRKIRYSREQKINRIQIDDGSAVNLFPLKTMKELGIPLDELLKSRLMIQGFNLEGQRTIGKVKLQLLIDDMESNPLFHVIDANTTYNINGQVKTVIANAKPFTTAEAHLVDAKFYLESTFVEEVQSKGDQGNDEGQSPREKGKKPFLCTKENNDLIEGLKNLTLPLTSLEESKFTKSPLKGFVRPTKGPLVKHDDFPSQRANGFDPNAYKLLIRAGYKQEEVSKLVHKPSEPTKETSQDLSKNRKAWQKKTNVVKATKSGFGFAPLKLKIHKETSRYIMTEEVDDEEDTPVESSRLSVFNRLGTATTRTSIFDRLNMPSNRGRPLILYIVAQERFLGALLAQQNDEGKESALYYLSRILNDPLKYLMSKLVLSGRLAKWALLLQEFDITYIPQKAVKGQALSDFLADYLIPDDWKFSEDLLDEDVLYIEILKPWKLYFDGAARQDGVGAGVIFITPEGEVLPYAFTLIKNYSNNMAEYQALIISLEMAVDMQITQLKVFGDSKLVINQVFTLYEVKKLELLPYVNYVKKLLKWFDKASMEHVLRKENRQADSLANLASVIASPNTELKVHLCKRWIIPPITLGEEVDLESNVVSVLEGGKEDWQQSLIDYLEHGKLPNDSRHKTKIKHRALRSIYFKGTLYRRSFDGVFLRCLGDEEAYKALQEAHSGICGAHQSGAKLHFQIKRMGYYWPTMVKDSMDYAKRCQACQFHANFIHHPSKPLHPTVTSWPFDAWGLDLVGPLPKSSTGHLYILAATNNFSKWVEAASYREVKKKTVATFIRTNIIYRSGVPQCIITDNGKQFTMEKLCAQFNFKQYNSSMYHAPANGLVEAFKKTLCNLFKKIANPVLPLERQIPSLRIAIQEGLSNEDNVRLRLEELEALDEKTLEAQQRLECYQARLSKAFNKKVKP
ncbi:Integrase [Theobroma cacao]|nr:Integrase [Theobroma cacao]